MLFSEESVRWGLLLIFSSVLSIYLSGYAFQRRDVPGAREFSFFTLTIALYSLGYALEINAQSLDRILYFMRYEVFWASFTAPAFLLFVIRFIRQKKGIPLVTLLLFILPLIIGFVSISGIHMESLYRSCVLLEGGDFPVIEYESGLWLKVQVFFLISCSLIAEILLLIHVIRVKGSLRVQTILVLLGGLLPTCSAILNPERTSITHLDLQPFLFFATVLLLSAALFRFRMLDISHITRILAVDKVRDSLLILDRHLIIRDINAMGRDSLLLRSFRIGRPLEKTGGSFAAYLRDHRLCSDPDRERGSFDFEDGKHFYRISVSRITEKGERFDGWLVHIRDDSSTICKMKTLEYQAENDDLTGISNRRHLLSCADRLLNDAKVRGTHLSFIIFDLDHFKNVNDSYGHLTGDKILVLIADAVKSQLRPSELFGRYGGEEFCIICPETEGKAAYAIAERLRKTIEGLSLETGDHVVGITASFGVCEWSGHDEPGSDMESLIEHADIALYTAKDQGRNRTVLYH